MGCKYRIIFNGIDLFTNLYRYKIIWNYNRGLSTPYKTFKKTKFKKYPTSMQRVKKNTRHKHNIILKKIKKTLNPYIICYISKNKFLSEKMLLK